MIYISHHLGLGDHFICNGLVRSIINNNEEYTIFVKPHNLDTVRFMYRDLSNLSFIKVLNCSFQNFLFEGDDRIIKINLENFNEKGDVLWDEYFYKQHNIDFKNRWDNFKFVRDFEREQSLYNFLNPNKEKFVLIHRSGSDGIDRINYNSISSEYKKIFVEKHTNNIFDYFLLANEAEEIHCVESCFLVLVDSFELNKSLFYHKNWNKRCEGFNFNLKNKWKII
jgi:hypothetical protein